MNDPGELNLLRHRQEIYRTKGVGRCTLVVERRRGNQKHTLKICDEVGIKGGDSAKKTDRRGTQRTRNRERDGTDPESSDEPLPPINCWIQVRDAAAIRLQPAPPLSAPGATVASSGIDEGKVWHVVCKWKPDLREHVDRWAQGVEGSAWRIRRVVLAKVEQSRSRSRWRQTEADEGRVALTSGRSRHLLSDPETILTGVEEDCAEVEVGQKTAEKVWSRDQRSKSITESSARGDMGVQSKRGMMGLSDGWGDLTRPCDIGREFWGLRKIDYEKFRVSVTVTAVQKKTKPKATILVLAFREISTFDKDKQRTQRELIVDERVRLEMYTNRECFVEHETYLCASMWTKIYGFLRSRSRRKVAYVNGNGSYGPCGNIGLFGR
ncbi:hypothetical protein B0H19DRAFT_1333069 [Mycena capillaripes]|nr:hypothetical protein B0H19DRAFT_1333069 [Mycena capillaripes]